VGQDAILIAMDDQDGEADRGQIAEEVFLAAVTQDRTVWADADIPSFGCWARRFLVLPACCLRGGPKMEG
jgi:hypothetical protein